MGNFIHGFGTRHDSDWSEFNMVPKAMFTCMRQSDSVNGAHVSQ
jgi:hypothetical protein